MWHLNKLIIILSIIFRLIPYDFRIPSILFVYCPHGIEDLQVVFFYIVNVHCMFGKILGYTKKGYIGFL